MPPYSPWHRLSRAHPDRRPGHPAPSADRRSREASDTGGRRADDPAHHSLARRRTASPISSSTCITARRPSPPSSATAAISACACAIRGRPRILGSGGGPRLALPLVGADPFFVINGDTLTDVDLARWRPHTPSRAPSSRWRWCPIVSPSLRRCAARRAEPRHRIRQARTVRGGFVSLHRRAGGAHGWRSPPFAPARRQVDWRRVRPAADRSAGHRSRDSCLTAHSGMSAPSTTTWRTTRAHSPRDDLGVRPPVRTDRSARVTRSILWDDVEVGAGCDVDRLHPHRRRARPGRRRYQRAHSHGRR